MGGFQGTGQPPEGGAGAGMGDILSLIGGLLGGGGGGGGGGCDCQSAACSATGQAIGALAIFQNFSLHALLKWLGSLRDWIKKVGNWFHTHVIQSIWNYLQRLKARLQKVLKPVIDYIKWEHEIWKMSYDMYVKPVVDFIQKLRNVLTIFRVLHVKWAVELDNVLSKVQGEIERVVIGITQQLNILSSYINLILDPQGLFNNNIYLDSLERSVGAVWGLLIGTSNKPAPYVGGNVQTPAWSNYTQPHAAVYASQTMTGGVQAGDQVLVDQARDSFQALGYKVY